MTRVPHSEPSEPDPRRVALAARTFARWGRPAVGERPGTDYRDSSDAFQVQVLVALFTLTVGPCQLVEVQAGAS